MLAADTQDRENVDAAAFAWITESQLAAVRLHAQRTAAAALRSRLDGEAS
ncbi:MAG: hypothetical protein ACJ72D_28290 [Marmoricola sp.]